MSNAQPLKVLACGDVVGRFSAWLKRLESVCRKAGPFDLALCVGSFFSPSDSSSAEDEAALEDVRSGRRRLPLPVYLLGPNSQAETAHFGDLGGYEICENLVYLGRHGCYTTREGLRVAYLSGSSEGSGEDAGKPFSHAYAQVKEMQVQLRWDDFNYQGVDVLLTSQWPQGISNSTSSRPDFKEDSCSKLVAKLAFQSRPRYHFAGLHGTHYERQPYRNHMVLKESARHVTRFIGLAKVGNPNKLKWLYAFNIVPMKTMDRRELAAQPTDATDCPFTAKDVAAEAEGSQGQHQFFYDMNAPVEEDARRKKGARKRDRRGAREDNPQEKKPRHQPTGPCWFCLSGTEVEKHLVVSVGDHSYMALPKGGLTPDHVLILPISHYASSLELPDEVAEEMSRFKGALRKCFKKQGKVVVFFERNYKSQHLQLQCVPLPKECIVSAKSVFMDAAETGQLEMTEVPDHAELTQMAEPGTPFFYVEMPHPTEEKGKTRLFHRVRRGFPIQFGREVLASRSLLNVEERVDWRECKESPDKEAETTKKFRKVFEPYDFTLEEEGEDD